MAEGRRWLIEGFEVICPEQLASRLPGERVLVMGGDGTLQAVINWCYRAKTRVLYLPLGNLNERGKQQMGEHPVVGVADGRVFTYVLATGIFCPLGWIAKTESKQRLGRLAYLAEVVGQYHVQSFPAEIEADGKVYRGRYTLVMLLRSKTCFGLPFNRAFASAQEGGHLLLIPSPGEDTLRNRIRLFFPLFRIFFVGLNQDYVGKCFVWQRVRRVRVDAPMADWCADGERWRLSSFDATWERSTATLDVCDQVKHIPY